MDKIHNVAKKYLYLRADPERDRGAELAEPGLHQGVYPGGDVLYPAGRGGGGPRGRPDHRATRRDTRHLRPHSGTVLAKLPASNLANFVGSGTGTLLS